MAPKKSKEEAGNGELASLIETLRDKFGEGGNSNTSYNQIYKTPHYGKMP